MLKYECDICHVIQEPADTYGPGVFTTPENRNVFEKGRPYQWIMHEALGDPWQGLQVMPTFERYEDAHICGACLGKTLIEMIKEMWPQQWQATFGLGDDEDLTGSSRADSNVSEVRAEPEMSEPSPDDSSSLCTCYWEGENFIERLGCPIHSFRRSPR